METIDQKMFLGGVRRLMEEVYLGFERPDGTWITENEPWSGFLGQLRDLSASEASSPIGYPDDASIAGHTNHLRYSLNLANRAFRGENAYENADWDGSWVVREVSDDEWRTLLAELETEYRNLVPLLSPGELWSNARMLTGVVGLVAHGAWHLGAIRQMIHALRG
jgi:hypothetical protein